MIKFKSSRVPLHVALLVATALAACKAPELRYMDRLGRDITMHDHERTIQFSLQKDGMLIVPEIGHTYCWYDKGKVSRSQGAYSGKVLHGLYREYDRETKTLLTSGKFAKGLQQGAWLRWNIKGLLKITQIYKNGQLNGPLVIYDSLGKPVDTLTYRRGVLLSSAELDRDTSTGGAQNKGLLMKVKSLLNFKSNNEQTQPAP